MVKKIEAVADSVNLADVGGSGMFITQEIKGAANHSVAHRQKRKLVFCCNLVHGLQFVELLIAICLFLIQPFHC